MKKLLAVLCFAATCMFTISAQDNEKDMLRQLIAEERETVDALVLYPSETRIAILEACLYPEALVKTNRVQQKTQESFNALIEKYPRDVQESVWDIARYPKLIGRLVEGGPKNRSVLTSIAADYPEEIREALIETGIDHYTLFKDIHALEEEATVAFEGILQEYPQRTREAYHSLLALPEVLTLLTDDIELAILTGDVYRKDPQWVLHNMDSLNLIVAQENAKELEEWKTSLEENPEVIQELQASAEEYAQEYEYDDAYYEGDDIYYDRRPDRDVFVHHYYHHYPYWFGYPYWYDYPRWRPYPYWWDWGFYFTPNHTIVIINLPSYYFTHWYFFRPQHHYYYPHLSAHFVNHHYYHPRPASSITVSVNQWKRTNRAVVTDDWLKAGGKQNIRVERLREFGKFEMDRDKYNAGRPQKQLTQNEYLDKYPDRYSQIPRIPKQPEYTQPLDKQGTRTVPMTPKREETKRPADVQKVPAKPPREVPKQPQPVEPKRDTPPKQSQPEMDKANAHHKNTWEGNKRTTEKAPAPTRTAPKTQPRTQTTKKTTPKRNG